MGVAPVLVEKGALNLTKFKVAKGYADGADVTDAPTVHRIAIQDILGERRDRANEIVYATQVGRERQAWMDQVAGEGSASNVDYSNIKSRYSEDGGSARQTIEKILETEFEEINPGSIVIIDEATYGLSPKRQENYVRTIQGLAKEKDLIVILAENSGYAYETSSSRIDLHDPQKGLHEPEAQDSPDVVVEKLESQEVLLESALGFNIDHEKIKALLDANPQFDKMLKGFLELPDSISFGPGKTEIFGDNASGKTTLLGAMFLLAKMEADIDQQIKFNELLPGNKVADRDEIREALRKGLANPTQTKDITFLQSLGFARELALSGAVSLNFRRQVGQLGVPGMSNGVAWLNLLEVSGEIKRDSFGVIGSNERSIEDVRRKIEAFKSDPDMKEGSTRQTSEYLLIKRVQEMPEGGILFVDEIDGGISPDRQLRFSNRLSKLAKERGITVIATSNSYEGYNYRITQSLDLEKPGEGVVSPVYKLKETAN